MVAVVSTDTVPVHTLADSPHSVRTGGNMDRRLPSTIPIDSTDQQLVAEPTWHSGRCSDLPVRPHDRAIDPEQTDSDHYQGVGENGR